MGKESVEEKNPLDEVIEILDGYSEGTPKRDPAFEGRCPDCGE